MDCGCAGRQARLNELRPGLGDAVAAAIPGVVGFALRLVIGFVGLMVADWVVARMQADQTQAAIRRVIHGGA